MMSILKQLAIVSVPAFVVSIILCIISYEIYEYYEYMTYKDPPKIAGAALVVTFITTIISGAIVMIAILYIFIKLIVSLFYLLL